MEVRTHTHTPPGKWTHYCCEFLLLFLAVPFGFPAKDQPEAKVNLD